MEKILNEAMAAARLAGQAIKKLREGNNFKSYIKNGYELVTTADILSDNIIRTELSKAYPNYKFISEEGENESDFNVQEPTWIIDPIDGTVGYANNHYQAAVSIAFAEGGKVKAGVVYNPFLEEMFYAMEGRGAFLNDNRIFASNVNTLKECVIGTGFPHDKENINDVVDKLKLVIPRVRDIRRLGSPALDICWVACGRLQGFYEEKLSPWDVAAAKLIAGEAGAKVGHYGYKNSLNGAEALNGYKIIVSNENIFEELKNILI